MTAPLCTITAGGELQTCATVLHLANARITGGEGMGMRKSWVGGESGGGVLLLSEARVSHVRAEEWQ